MSWQRLIVRLLAVMLVGVVLLAGISRWADSTVGERDSAYSADAAAFAGHIDRGLITRGEYLAKLDASS